MKKNGKNSPFEAAIYTENTFSEPEEGEILSLDALRKAFAGFNDETGSSDGGFLHNAVDNTEIQEELEYSEYFTSEEGVFVSEDGGSEQPEHAAKISPQSVVEAILFVGSADNKYFSAEKIAEKMRNVEAEEIDLYAGQLNEKYLNSACPYHIVKENGGYRMVLREEFDSIRAGFYGKTREVRLAQAAVDTLAAVAYRQPVSADEIQNLRKQPSGTLLLQLVNRGLLKTETVPRNGKKTLLYRTSKRFLELFQLENLDDLPVLDED